MKSQNLFRFSKMYISINKNISKDPYVLLSVDKETSLKDVKKAYFKLAKKYHPDLNPDSEYANKMFLLSNLLS